VAEQTTLEARGLDTGACVLWASAMMILSLIVVQAGRLGGSPALAGEVDDAAGVRIMSADNGNQEDYVAVINDRTQTLAVYGVLNARSIELFDVQRLPDLFDQAARSAGGAAGAGR